MSVRDTGTIAALGHHFAATRGSVEVAVTVRGPFAMTYVNPKDDPTKGKPATK